MDTTEILNRARPLFEYLAMRDPQTELSDLIIGFGHFDPKIPQHCAALFQRGLAKKIMFSGGRGAGSADLQEPEAVYFKNEFLKAVPSIAADDLIIESESTNTGENISFSETVLQNRDPEFCFASGIGKLIAVASPYRQKRVNLALKKMYPAIRVFNSPPQTTFEAELKLFEAKNEDFILLLLGELERIMQYPQKGFIAYEAIPPEVARKYQELKGYRYK